MQNYKELKVWEKSHQFTPKGYQLTLSFPKEELYGLTNQLRRAASSVPANIAEGCGKNTRNELAHFLNVSLGAANESKYFLILAKDLKYILPEDFEISFDNINEIKAMLISLINKVRSGSLLKT